MNGPKLNLRCYLSSKKNLNYQIQDWGLIDYQIALDKQIELLNQISLNQAPETIIYCSHPPIVTLGRKTQEGDLFGWQGPQLQVARGGRATYHGPSQIVIYTLIKMKNPEFPRRDIIWLIRTLEKALIETLKFYKLNAKGKLENESSAQSQLENTGVWINEKKIASIGIGVKNWISYHGMAINIDFDPLAFQGLKPCGYSSSVMTSLEQETQKKINRSEFIFCFEPILIQQLFKPI